MTERRNSRPCAEPGRSLWFSRIGALLDDPAFDAKLEKSHAGRKAVPDGERTCRVCGASGDEIDLIPTSGRQWTCRAQQAMSYRPKKREVPTDPLVVTSEELAKSGNSARIASGYSIVTDAEATLACRAKLITAPGPGQTATFFEGDAFDEIVRVLLAPPAGEYLIVTFGQKTSYEMVVSEGDFAVINGGLTVGNRVVGEVHVGWLRDLLEVVDRHKVTSKELLVMHDLLLAQTAGQETTKDGAAFEETRPDAAAALANVVQTDSAEFHIVLRIMKIREAAAKECDATSCEENFPS